MSCETKPTQATGRPWRVRGDVVITHRQIPGEKHGINETSVLSLERPPAERHANAALIVRAVNTFDKAREALRLVLSMNAYPGVAGAQAMFTDRIGAMDAARAVLAEMDGEE